MSRLKQLERNALAAIANHNTVNLRSSLLGGLRNSHTVYRGPPTFESFSLLDFCVTNNYTEGVRLLLSGPFINTMVPLDNACHQQKDDIVRVILNKSLAIRRCCSESLFTLLKNHRHRMANAYVRDPQFVINDQELMVSGLYLKSGHGRAGQSPLHVTCFLSSPFTTDLLLSNGAIKDIPDNDGFTPLFVACSHGHYICTLILLRHGASTAYTNSAQYPMQRPNSALYALCHLSDKSNLNDQIVELLEESVDFTKETWLNNPSVHTQTKYVSDGTYAKLKRWQKTPANIFTLTMRTIRARLNQGASGKSIFSMYDQLGPQVAKSLVAKLKMSKFN